MIELNMNYLDAWPSKKLRILCGRLVSNKHRSACLTSQMLLHVQTLNLPPFKRKRIETHSNWPRCLARDLNESNDKWSSISIRKRFENWPIKSKFSWSSGAQLSFRKTKRDSERAEAGRRSKNCWLKRRFFNSNFLNDLSGFRNRRSW